MRRSAPITVHMSDELVAAVDALAFQNDESRAACIRRIVADELRDSGLLALKAPPLHQLGQHNPFYRTRRSRA